MSASFSARLARLSPLFASDFMRARLKVENAVSEPEKNAERPMRTTRVIAMVKLLLSIKERPHS